MAEHLHRDPSHDLRALVHRTLVRTLFCRPRNLSVELEQDAVVLTGTVGSYYHKQLAQESIRAIEGVARIRNEIEVVRPHHCGRLAPRVEPELAEQAPRELASSRRATPGGP